MIKRILKNLLLTITVTVFITGCATWQSVSKDKEIKSNKASFKLNRDKWYSLNEENRVILTRDGITLQNILLEVTTLDKSLFTSKKIIPESILSHELAELLLEDLRLAHKNNAFKLIANNPTQIAKKDSIELVYQLRDNYDNLIKVNSTYFIFDKKLYKLSYRAPNLHFYNNDLQTYKDVKNNLKLNL